MKKKIVKASTKMFIQLKIFKVATIFIIMLEDALFYFLV